MLFLFMFIKVLDRVIWMRSWIVREFLYPADLYGYHLVHFQNSCLLCLFSILSYPRLIYCLAKT